MMLGTLFCGSPLIETPKVTFLKLRHLRHLRNAPFMGALETQREVDIQPLLHEPVTLPKRSNSTATREHAITVGGGEGCFPGAVSTGPKDAVRGGQRGPVLIEILAFRDASHAKEESLPQLTQVVCLSVRGLGVTTLGGEPRVGIADLGVGLTYSTDGRAWRLRHRPEDRHGSGSTT